MRPGQVRFADLHHPTHRPDRLFPPAAVQALACPHCGAGLMPEQGSFRCPTGHSFDVARQGYVSLLGRHARTDTGDSAEMVDARLEFLGAGYYSPIAEAVAAAVTGTGSGRASGPVLEIGAGPGYYLSAALAPDPRSVGLAIDSSKFAARRAAAAPRVLSVVADAWSSLPVRSGSIGTVLSIFAPRDPAEITRVLAADGRLVAVTPTPAHLLELRARLSMLTVDDGKADRLTDSFAGLLAPVSQHPVHFPMRLDRPAVAALIGMGPTARHLSVAERAQQISSLDEIETVTCSVTVSILGR